MWLLLILIILSAVAYYLYSLNLIPNIYYFINPRAARPEISASPQPGTIPDSIDWSGTYTFSESASPDQIIKYTITVTKENSLSYIAWIDIDGFQTLERLSTNGTVINKRLVLKFDSYRQDSNIIQYHQGEWLLSLEPIDGDAFKVIWNKIKPRFNSTNISSSVFIKTR
jgi:hypothetical protein